MSLAPSQPGKTRPKPPSWGWGPDGRYTPLTDNGELPLHLPGHLELPEENGEIVENFREQPQGEILDQGIRPILERIHPDLRYALGHDCGIYWRLTDPPVKRRRLPGLVLCSRCSARASGRLSAFLCALEGKRSPHRPHRVRLRPRREGARSHASRGEILGLRAGGPRRVLCHLHRRHGRAGGLSAPERAVSTAPPQRTQALSHQTAGSRAGRLAWVSMQ